MPEAMTKEEYLKYRDEKVRLNMDQLLSSPKGNDMTEKEINAFKFGLEVGINSATKGGKFVNL